MEIYEGEIPALCELGSLRPGNCFKYLHGAKGVYMACENTTAEKGQALVVCLNTGRVSFCALAQQVFQVRARVEVIEYVKREECDDI